MRNWLLSPKSLQSQVEKQQKKNQICKDSRFTTPKLSKRIAIQCILVMQKQKTDLNPTFIGGV